MTLSPSIFVVYNKVKGTSLIFEIGQAYTTLEKAEEALRLWEKASPQFDFGIKEITLLK